MSVEIIYQDKNFIAVNKPAGMLTHPVLRAQEKRQGKNLGGERGQEALTDFLVKKFPEIKEVGDDPFLRPGIVHRLDKDTSGVILIARNQPYFDYLKNLFQTRRIKKTYLALVQGELKEKKGVIERVISLKSGSVKRTVHKGKEEKPAITEYRTLKNLILRKSPEGKDLKEKFSLLEVSPKTGRTHQIRVHLASISHPVAGDNLYGPKNFDYTSLGLNRQFLHAQSVEFNTEEGRRVKIEADLPPELKNVLKKFRAAQAAR